MRNAIKNLKMISYRKIHNQCQLTICQLVRSQFSWIKDIPHQLNEMIEFRKIQTRIILSTFEVEEARVELYM